MNREEGTWVLWNSKMLSDTGLSLDMSPISTPVINAGTGELSLFFQVFSEVRKLTERRERERERERDTECEEDYHKPESEPRTCEIFNR
jgi:hypothetical protein